MCGPEAVEVLDGKFICNDANLAGVLGGTRTVVWNRLATWQ